MVYCSGGAKPSSATEGYVQSSMDAHLSITIMNMACHEERFGLFSGGDGMCTACHPWLSCSSHLAPHVVARTKAGLHVHGRASQGGKCQVTVHLDQ